jgi:hypothetical protein
MVHYDLARVKREVASLPDGDSTTSKGRKLQDLVEYLLCEIPAVKVSGRNVLNVTRSEEKDLWIVHRPAQSSLPFVDISFPVECKNEETAASSAEVREFAAKIRASGGSDGLLVATKGLAGRDTPDSAHDAIKMELSRGTRIIVLVVADIPELVTADDLVSLLIDRHLELRVHQTYRTI